MKSAEIDLLWLMRRRGSSFAQISDYLKRPVQTLRRWAARDDPEIPLFEAQTRPKRGVPATSAAVLARRAALRCQVRKVVVKNSKRYPRTTSLRGFQLNLFNESRIVVSRMSISRDFKAMDFVNRVRPKICTMAAKDHAKRKDFAHRHARSGRRGYLAGKKCVFTDEKIFTCNEQSGRCMYVRRGHTALPRENTRWGPRVMVWGAIGYDFAYFMVLPKPRKTDETWDENSLNSLTSMKSTDVT